MIKELEVQKRITINAAPEEVWKAITDPEIVKKYFFGAEVITDWKVGSPLIFQGELEGKPYRDKGTILAVEPERMLQYNYWSGFTGLEDSPENYSVVTYRLIPEDHCTLLILTQVGFASEEAKEHAVGGWEMVLTNMKKLLEESSDVL